MADQTKNSRFAGDLKRLKKAKKHKKEVERLTKRS
jgi:hypothetical protein